MNGNYWIAAVVAPLLPVLVGLVTKKAASRRLKTALLLLLSLVGGTVNQIATENPVLDGKWLVATLVSWAVATATYYGVYKPRDLGEKLLPERGIG